MNDKPQDLEVRICLLEDFRDRTLEHHRQTMEKLDKIVTMLNMKDCTLHASRMLQLDQDLTRVRDVEIKELVTKVDGIAMRMAVWSGAVGVLTFLAAKLFK